VAEAVAGRLQGAAADERVTEDEKISNGGHVLRDRQRLTRGASKVVTFVKRFI
jgi:hypothetical protein